MRCFLAVSRAENRSPDAGVGVGVGSTVPLGEGMSSQAGKGDAGMRRERLWVAGL